MVQVVAIRVRRLPGAWLTYRVLEVTSGGALRNAYDFDSFNVAMAYARQEARRLGVPVERV